MTLRQEATARQQALLRLCGRVDPGLLQSTSLFAVDAAVTAGALTRAVADLHERHTLLRYRADGDCLVETGRVPLGCVDADPVTAAERARAWSLDPLDPGEGLWQAVLFGSGDGQVLGVKTHDLGFDQRAVDILVEDLVLALDGAQAPAGGEDFWEVVEELRDLEADADEAELDATVDEIVACDGGLVTGDRSGRRGVGPNVRRQVRVGDFGRVSLAAAQRRRTPYAVQLTAVVQALHELDGRPGRAVGVTVDRRPLVDADRVVGPLSQGAVLCLRLDTVAADEVCELVQQRLLALLMRQATPFERVVQAWRRRGYPPPELAAVTVNHRQVRDSWRCRAGTLVPLEVPAPPLAGAGADVMVTLDQFPDELALRFDLNAELFSPCRADELADRTVRRLAPV